MATTSTTTNIPEWLSSATEDMVGRATALTDTNANPYQTYTGERAAQFTPLQNTAFTAAANIQPSGATQSGIDLAQNAGLAALNTSYTPTNISNQYQPIQNYTAGQFGNQFQTPQSYQSGQFSASQVGLPGALQMYQMGPAQNVRADTFGDRQAASYMSPYIQQALEPQLREASRVSEMQRNQNQAQAVAQNAFGGSRSAIVEAERQKNLLQQRGDITSKGYQTAYEQAANQFNQDAARRLQAGVANQQAGLTTGQQNLGAALGVQQLGTNAGLQASLANQQYGLQAQQLAEQSRQFGASQGLTAAQLQAQYGLSAQQAEEASRQFSANYAAQQAAQQAQYGQAAQQLGEQANQYGAGLSLQGLQTSLAGAGQLNTLGNSQYQQYLDAMKMQAALGTQQQGQVQQQLDYDYQNFLAQQQYPYSQLSYLSNILRGTPMSTTSSTSMSDPSTSSQVLGGMTTLAGLYALGGGFKVKDGGQVFANRAGLAELAVDKV